MATPPDEPPGRSPDHVRAAIVAALAGWLLAAAFAAFDLTSWGVLVQLGLLWAVPVLVARAAGWIAVAVFPLTLGLGIAAMDFGPGPLAMSFWGFATFLVAASAAGSSLGALAGRRARPRAGRR